MTRMRNWLLFGAATVAACASQDKASRRSTETETPAIEVDTLALNCRKAAAARVADSASINDRAREKPVVFGYLFGVRFYPLVLLEAGGFDNECVLVYLAAGTLTNPPYMMHLALAGREVRALANVTQVTQLVAETAYVDPYNDDRPGKFGAFATPLPRGVVVFASLGPAIEATDFRSDTAGVRSFYRFFSRDDWGRHFFDDISPDAPLQIVADSSNVRAHGMSDLDRDGNPELWLTYQLMWGEIGAMVWERTLQGWRMIGYHCFRCD